MLQYPNAKINIGLVVRDKRDDGFHNIESIFYPLPVYDALECIENKKYSSGHSKFGFTMSGLQVEGSDEANLVAKAYRLIDAEFELPPVLCHLHKHIPMGAGLGGGSADGAFMLRMINELFGLNLSEDHLRLFAEKLGSDCPFFVYNQPMLISGRGEILNPVTINLKGWYFVLIYPSLSISTKEAYQQLVRSTVDSVDFTVVAGMSAHQWKHVIYNEFENYAFIKHPVIREIREHLYTSGAVYASMTGSGSAVYGLFSDEPDETLFDKNNYQVFSGRL